MKNERGAVGELPRPLLTSMPDEATIALRSLDSDDFAAVLALSENLTGDELYLRYFTHCSTDLTRWPRSARATTPARIRLGVFEGIALVAVGTWVSGEGSDPGQLGIVVAHRDYDRDIAAILLAHLGEYARSQGAQYLALHVFATDPDVSQLVTDAGWTFRQHHDGEIVTLEVDLTTISPSGRRTPSRASRWSMPATSVVR